MLVTVLLFDLNHVLKRATKQKKNNKAAVVKPGDLRGRDKHLSKHLVGEEVVLLVTSQKGKEGGGGRCILFRRRSTSLRLTHTKKHIKQQTRPSSSLSCRLDAGLEVSSCERPPRDLAALFSAC